MLQTIPDPFDSYGSHDSENRIFSVLQPLALLHENSPSATSLTPNATSRVNAACMLDEVRGSDQGNPSTSSESPRSALRYAASVGFVSGSGSTENSQDHELEIREQESQDDYLSGFKSLSPSGTIKDRPPPSSNDILPQETAVIPITPVT